MGSTKPVGHGSGYDGSREETGTHVAKSSGEVHHPDHMQRQQVLLQHQQRQQLQQDYHHHRQQNKQVTTEDQQLRTQYRLNALQSDSATFSASPTQSPLFEQKSTPPMTTYQKDSVTSQKNTEVTNHRLTETETASQKEGNERDESGPSNSGDTAGAELASQGKGKDSKVTSEDAHLTEKEKREKILETVQRELDRESHLHPHHPQQRPRPTTFKTGIVQL